MKLDYTFTFKGARYHTHGRMYRLILALWPCDREYTELQRVIAQAIADGEIVNG